MKTSKNEKKNKKDLKTVVYTHTNLKTGEIFYVGAGIPSRPKSANSRSQKWMKEYLELGWNNIKVDIVQEFYSQDEALDYEQYLIKEIGRQDLGTGSLINQTNGGLGRSGAIYVPRLRKNKASIFDFKTGQITNTSELNKDSQHATNYYYRLANGTRGDHSQFKFIDLMDDNEIINLVKKYKNKELLKFI